MNTQQLVVLMLGGFLGPKHPLGWTIPVATIGEARKFDTYAEAEGASVFARGAMIRPAAKFQS